MVDGSCCGDSLRHLRTSTSLAPTSFIPSNSWSMGVVVETASDTSGLLLLLLPLLSSLLSLDRSLSLLLFLLSPFSSPSPPTLLGSVLLTTPTLRRSWSTLFIFFWFSLVSTISLTILSTLLWRSPTVLDTVSFPLSSPDPTTTAPESSPCTTAHTCSVLLWISSLIVERLVTVSLILLLSASSSNFSILLASLSSNLATKSVLALVSSVTFFL